jgi:REP element-mobilizing transposase RayT
MEPTIDAQREQWVRDSIQSTCSGFSVVQYEVGVMPDHVHLFVALPPVVSISQFVGRIKGGSSHYISNRERNRSFAWQSEYGAYTIHENQICRLLEYILNQREHHVSNNLEANLEITERALYKS